MSSLSRVLLCSGITGLKEALERVLAKSAVRVEEIDSAALNNPEAIRKWSNEVLVADNDRLTQNVLYAPKDTLRFVQVITRIIELLFCLQYTNSLLVGLSVT